MCRKTSLKRERGNSSLTLSQSSPIRDSTGACATNGNFIRDFLRHLEIVLVQMDSGRVCRDGRDSGLGRRNANQTDPEVRRLSSAAATRDARCHIVVSLSLFDSGGGGGIWVSLNLSILRFLRYSASGKIQTRKREEERGVRRGRLLPEIEMWREGRGRGGQAG